MGSVATDTHTTKLRMELTENSQENMRNINMNNLVGSVNKVRMENITETIQKMMSEERLDQMKRYVTPVIKTTRVLVYRVYQVSKPAIKELCLFLLTCAGPWLFLLLAYLCTALISFSKYLSQRLNKPEAPAINRALALIANTWSAYTRLYHDQTFQGLENIPKDSAALLIWYHGPVPVDYFGLVARIYARDGRMVNTIVDRCLTALPGYENVEKYLKASAGGKGYCVDLLENGELLAVAPGGSREALFDESYSSDWGDRTGFAKVALLTGAPIIPIFTENIREAYCTMSTGRKIWRYIFNQTKLPIIPIYGGFPVKLTTHIGTPIRVTQDETAHHLKERVQGAIAEMISTHQRSEPSIKEAVMDRMTSLLETWTDPEMMEAGLQHVEKIFENLDLKE